MNILSADWQVYPTETATLEVVTNFPPHHSLKCQKYVDLARSAPAWTASPATGNAQVVPITSCHPEHSEGPARRCLPHPASCLLLRPGAHASLSPAPSYALKR